MNTIFSQSTRFVTVNDFYRAGSFRFGEKTTALLVSFILCVFITIAHQGVVQAGAPKADAPKSRDIMEFLGALTDEQAAKVNVSDDCFLIALKRRIDSKVDRTPKNYYVLVKGISPLEKQVLQDATDGRWDRFDLLQASLIAEGVQDVRQIRKCEQQLGRLVDTIRENAKQNPTFQKDGEELTKFIFENLHRQILTGQYNIDYTNLAKVLETGDYNCVSATVLFNSLAQKSGLDVCGLEMPGHVLSRAKYGSKAVDLETTCPNWYALKNEAQRQDATLSKVAAENRSGEGRRSAAKPDSNFLGNSDRVRELSNISKNLREISDVQLVAAVYYNQGYDHWQGERFAEAVVANAKALHLDPNNETTWGNLIGAINNLAIGYSLDQKRYDVAASLLDQISLLDPEFESLRTNQLHIYYMWIKELGVRGAVDDANRVYAQAEARLQNSTELKNLILSVRRGAVK